MKKIIGFLMSFIVLIVISSVQNTVSANTGDDTLGTATIANPTSTQKGILNGYFDKDYYKVTMPSNGQLTVKMDNAGDSKTVSVYDANEELLTYLTTDNEKLGKATRSIGLAKGKTVYMRVSGSSKVSYSLLLSFKVGDNYEKETNDIMSAANKISLTSKTTGEIVDYSDKDFFKVTLKSPGNIRLQMSNTGNEKNVVLMNSQQESIGSFSTNKDLIGNKTINVALPKGTFYIKVSSSYKVTPYVLNLKYTKSNFYEKEINDTIAAASKVTLNKYYKGTTQGYNDDDYFKFTLKSTKTVKIYLSNKTNYQSLTLYKNNSQSSLDYLSTDSSSPQKYVYMKTKLKKGTYYFKVRGSNSAYVDYEVKVSTK